jgi:hypothetical protein
LFSFGERRPGFWTVRIRICLIDGGSSGHRGRMGCSGSASGLSANGCGRRRCAVRRCGDRSGSRGGRFQTLARWFDRYDGWFGCRGRQLGERVERFGHCGGWFGRVCRRVDHSAGWFGQVARWFSQRGGRSGRHAKRFDDRVGRFLQFAKRDADCLGPVGDAGASIARRYGAFDLGVAMDGSGTGKVANVCRPRKPGYHRWKGPATMAA